METVGVLLLSIGAWVMYCGTYGINPSALAMQILKDPSNATNLISAARQAAASSATNTVSGGTLVTSGDGAAVVAFARAQLGKPYNSPGDSVNTWDCSGLTKAAYGHIGITLPHSAAAQLAMGTPVTDRSQLQLGDLLFPTGVGTALGDHVQIYSGNGNIIEAPDWGEKVRERSMWGFAGNSVTGRRYVKKAAVVGTPGGFQGTPVVPGPNILGGP